MKKTLILFCLVILTAIGCVGSMNAQGTVEPKVQRDPLLEVDSKKNLEAARLYFKLRKAYKAVLLRCEETIAANPQFSQIDEVLYLAGMSSYYLAEGKGKQQINQANEEEKKKYAPERLREEAVAYLSQLRELYPNSKFKSEAEKTLTLLGENVQTNKKQ